MEQLLEKQGDGEAGVNSEEGAQGWDTCPGSPDPVTPLPEVPKRLSGSAPDPAPALTHANLSLTFSPFSALHPAPRPLHPPSALPGSRPLPVSPEFPPPPASQPPGLEPSLRPRLRSSHLRFPRSRHSELT